MVRPFRICSRALDLVVVLCALALMSVPFWPSSNAATSSVPVTVDQEVRNTAMISRPVNGSFKADLDGKSNGKIDWVVYSSADEGFKLVVSSDRRPAMRDTKSSTSIADYGSSPKAWSVGSSDRRFGFSAQGDQALDAYGGGSKWRGFTGTRSIEIARRRKGPVALTTTSVMLASEMRRPLPSNAKPHATVVATVMQNL